MPIVVGVGILLLVIVVISQLDSAVKRARNIVNNSSNINDMMKNIDILIKADDDVGMHMAVTNCISQILKSQKQKDGRQAALWRGSVGVKLNKWCRDNNPDDYKTIQPYLDGPVIPQKYLEKYDNMISMLKDADETVIDNVTKFNYFKDKVFPKMNLDLMQSLPGKTHAETKDIFTKSVKFLEYSKISAKPIDWIYYNMTNPRIRTDIIFNDLKYHFKFTIDVHMKQVGNKMIIDTFSLLESGAENGK